MLTNSRTRRGQPTELKSASSQLAATIIMLFSIGDQVRIEKAHPYLLTCMGLAAGRISSG